MIAVCGAALIAVIMSVVLKRRESALSPFVGEISAITITVNAIAAISELMDIFGNMRVDNGIISTLLSACAIAIICQSVCNICKANGENSLAYAIELSGNAELIVLSLPYLRSVWQQIFEVLKL